MSTSNGHTDEQTRIGFEKFKKAVSGESDDIVQVLKSHLYTEHLLERIFLLRLPRGDKLLDGAALTYAQKVLLVEALGSIDDAVASSLKALNKVRNHLVHELGRQISDVDLLRIGSPLGKEFTRMRKEVKDDPSSTLKSVCSYLCGYLSATCAEHEARIARASESRDKRTVSQIASEVESPKHRAGRPADRSTDP